MDIAFLADGSKDVTEINFRLQVKFVTTIAEALLISKEGIHAGFAIISGDGLLVSDFSSNTDTASFLSAIGMSPYPGESREAGKSLIFVMDKLFASSGRKNAVKVIITLVLSSIVKYCHV